jgi:F-type H+-transporting ATPase subunit b|uniref:ATP synthase CFO B chain subunit I n=1 Tax=Thorea hispida TaxID=202687 RepID=A0A1C9CAC6_9FLOR|nr:ATP synthase CFO B chain subunit I [Thorea hispida]AOM65338.1 ATP synthase CFO B chain subunit I [Thorea hispida]ARX95898.1 ATP synthase CFO B chain subunit I [Thorea hispida]
MNNLIQLFGLFSLDHPHHQLGFNPNILETNVINIIILLSGLIYVLKNFLGSSLSIRQEKVLIAIQEAEEKLNQATIRLEQSKNQLKQTQDIIANINHQANLTAQKVQKDIIQQGKIDIEKLTQSSKASIANAKEQIKKQIQKQIINLAIHRVFMELNNQLTSEIQSSIIDKKISQLNIKL